MNHLQDTTVLKAWIGLLCLVLLPACGPTTAPSPIIPAIPTEAASATAAPIPTSTDTPAPTPLPGTQVYPVSSLASSIPWLPQDRSRNPFSAYYGFNFKQPPFNDLLVRKAFAAAVDKELVAQEALGFKMREAVPAMTLTPASVLARDLYGEVGIPFDPVEAKALLEQAGYASVDAFPPTTLIVYMRSSAAPGVHFRIAEAVVEMWKTHLGITVQIEAVESPPAMVARMQNSAPAMFVYGWGADYVDPDNFLKALFHSQSESNHGDFYSPEFDRYVDEAAELSDPAERQALYIQAERIISERDVALIPLFHSLGYLQP